MPLLLLTLVFPFLFFIGGAYVLGYPAGLGLLYGINVTLIYIVALAVANRVVRIHSQRLEIHDGNLILSRKQMSLSSPITCQCEMAVPIEDISTVELQQTRAGYELTVRFEEAGKMMGVDLDINPLKSENRHTLERVLRINPDIEVNKQTREVLDRFEEQVSSWKGSYLLSLLVIGLSLAVFFVISIYLGAKYD